MDDIQYHCARSLSTDPDVHSAAHQWLRDCQAFRRVLDREHDMDLFDVASMLTPESTGFFSNIALKMLADELMEGIPC
jgi:hypothetical protein